MTSAYTDYGTLLKRSGTTIAEVIAIEPPEENNPASEATSHSSSGYREYISQMLLGLSEFSCTINYFSDTTHDSLHADLVAGTAQAFTIVLPNSLGTYTFNAIVTKFKTLSGADAKNPKPIQATVSFQPTGSYTFA